MKLLKNTKIIAAAGVLITAILALVAVAGDWSVETVALVGGISAAALGLWRAVAAVKSKAAKTTTTTIALLAAGLALSCTAQQRRAVAVTTIAASADAARCLISCADNPCRTACLRAYGADIARDLLTSMLMAAEIGADRISISVEHIEAPARPPESGAAPPLE